MVSTSYASYGLYPSIDAPQVPTLLGVVASVFTPLPTETQQLPTLMAQQCWEMCPFKVALRLCHSETHKAEVLLEKRDVQGKRLVVEKRLNVCYKIGSFFREVSN